MPLINPTPRPYLRATWRLVPWVMWETVTDMDRTACRGLPRHTVPNGTLVYPSEGGRYRAEGCEALGRDSSFVNDPPGGPGRTPLYADIPSAWSSADGDLRSPSPLLWEGSLIGDSERDE